MKYCKKCGAPIDKQSGCCVNCGLRAEGSSAKKGNFGIKVVVAAVVVILLLLGGKLAINAISAKLGVASDDGYMDVVEEMINAVYVDYDLEKFASLMPDAVVQNVIDKKYDGDEQAFREELQASYETVTGSSALPESVTWVVNEEFDLTGFELVRYREVYEEESGLTDKIKYAKGLDITVSYSDADGETKEDNIYVLIGMIGNEWYLLAYS